MEKSVESDISGLNEANIHHHEHVAVVHEVPVGHVHGHVEENSGHVDVHHHEVKVHHELEG